ncbi:putative poly(A) polymerase catalytic subunit [Pacmanvirus S19]|nr:putative poly(A) polymerase catalytic subunit [Pacmanvirus S19]
MDISEVLEKSKEYENVVIKHDPAYNNIIDAIEIVKKFIIDNGLILYGGCSIDYALRLHGDKIYPDELPPDLDFYSYDNVEHAYQLADILYEHGFKEARAINAEHMETMRVDIIDNHFIADISYRPREIFDKLPYLEYNGMKIIHPLFQRLDLHSSLAFPYDNVPREVIFSRWSKDVKRFNKLDEYYPIEAPKDKLQTREMTVPTDIKKYVLNGFAAYALIYTDFCAMMKEFNAKPTSIKDITSAKFVVSQNQITFDTLNQRIEFIHFDIDKMVEKLNISNVKKYEPYINMIPEKIDGSTSFGDITIYSTHNRLVSANSVTIGDITFRTVNVQFLLKYFLAMHFVHKDSAKLSAVYLDRYISLIKMISAMEDVLKGKDVLVSVQKSPLFLSVQTYGNENINLARQVALNRLYVDLGEVPAMYVPRNYYAERSIANKVGHPEFKYDESPIFRELGREIKD